jgi:protein arginine kinase activator
MFCNNPATVHLTDIVNKKKREAHLCEQCARERNLLPDPPGPQIDLTALMNLLLSPFQQPQGGALAPAAEPACPACGLTYAAFKAEGRFGCGHDYDAFRVVLEPLLERVHRATAHAGKQPASARRLAELEDLRAKMKSAIAIEDYEQAARLRDLIRQKEAEGTPDEPR